MAGRSWSKATRHVAAAEKAASEREAAHRAAEEKAAAEHAAMRRQLPLKLQQRKRVRSQRRSGIWLAILSLRSAAQRRTSRR